LVETWGGKWGKNKEVLMKWNGKKEVIDDNMKR